jgi:hypothetical protein
VSKYKEESFVKMKEILTKKYKIKWNSEVCPLMKSLETEESFQVCQDLLLEEILYVLLKITNKMILFTIWKNRFTLKIVFTFVFYCFFNFLKEVSNTKKT